MSTAANDPVVSFYERYPFPNALGIVAPGAEGLKRFFGRRGNYRTLLSVGCGTGEELLCLREALPSTELTAIEPSRTSAALARERCPWATIHAATIETFSPSRRFEAVYCSGVLHHTADPAANLRRMRDWLEDDGDLILSVYHHARWECAPTRPPNEAQFMDTTANPRERTYSWRSFMELLEGAGFRGVRTHYHVPLPVPRGALACAVYDAVWLGRRVQMVAAFARKK